MSGSTNERLPRNIRNFQNRSIEALNISEYADFLRYFADFAAWTCLIVSVVGTTGHRCQSRAAHPRETLLSLASGPEFISIRLPRSLFQSVMLKPMLCDALWNFVNLSSIEFNKIYFRIVFIVANCRMFLLGLASAILKHADASKRLAPSLEVMSCKGMSFVLRVLLWALPKASWASCLGNAPCLAAFLCVCSTIRKHAWASTMMRALLCGQVST